ncbi:MAG: hypothetical protein ACJAY8_000845 [Sphingobacteriales bacterium]|jgi:hypothetical protein
MGKGFLNQVLQATGIVAAVAIFFVLLSYALGADFMVGPWANLIAFVGVIVAMVITGKRYRNSIGGIISFGAMWKFLVSVTVIFAVALGLFEYLLFQVIDPEFHQILTEKTLELTYQRFQNFGIPEDQMAELMEDTQKNIEAQSTFKGVLMGMGVRIVIYGIISLIIAAVLKKKDPEQL